MPKTLKVDCWSICILFKGQGLGKLMIKVVIRAIRRLDESHGRIPMSHLVVAVRILVEGAKIPEVGRHGLEVAGQKYPD